jgi:hypothetical protein
MSEACSAKNETMNSGFWGTGIYNAGHLGDIAGEGKYLEMMKGWG